MTVIARHASKVPAITLGFWLIKILATTLGETAGDTLSMTVLGEAGADPQIGNGYLIASAVFVAIFAVLAAIQIAATRFRPFLYWATIIASTTAGTTMADFATRALGIGYTGGSALLLACVLGTLFAWWRTLGAISADTIHDRRAELFYWLTITFSQTLGTALGDWAADTGGLGYLGGAAVFGAALAVTAALYYLTSVSRVALFWAAFILTRPLGATVGDFLDKPVAKGGLDLSRPLASAVLAGTILALLLVLPQRAGGAASPGDER